LIEFMVDLAAANHTGRELSLMLSGGKPLAMFHAEVSELPDEGFIPEEAFRPHVLTGRFVRDEAILESDYAESLGRTALIKYVLFAPIAEAWRIPAMRLLKESFRKSRCRWNDALERIEGTLLGYTDEEMTAWISQQTLWKLEGESNG
jgi:hypothetical protein